MENNLDLKDVVKHIVNGTLEENLCRICLMPLDEHCENILTTVCKDYIEFSVAGILEAVCKIKISESEQSNVCSNCFNNAIGAYKFYIRAQQTDEILNFFVDDLLNNVNAMTENDLSESTCFKLQENNLAETLCLKIPEFIPSTLYFDFDLESLSLKNSTITYNVLQKKLISSTTTTNVSNRIKFKKYGTKINKNDDEVIIVKNDEGSDPIFYKVNDDGTYSEITGLELKLKLQKLFDLQKNKSKHKKPIPIKQCTRCPFKYRYITKIKVHMKDEHGIDVFACKQCRELVEGRKEYKKHLKTHQPAHTCPICNMTFQKLNAIMCHMNHTHPGHESHICDLCGKMLPSECSVKAHYDRVHKKTYTCYYCGRMYKGEPGLQRHIERHERLMSKSKKDKAAKDSKEKKRDRLPCPTCGHTFVDERALLWHQRLHTNERPYKCEECGREFISENRRNQHVICSHRPPQHRCPLCPALFHMRSMVNTHIKKVHLNNKKRRRFTKYKEVNWRTAPVPIADLSIAVQNRLLELQTKQESDEES